MIDYIESDAKISIIVNKINEIISVVNDMIKEFNELGITIYKGND